MNDNESTIRIILDLLAQGSPLVLASIVSLAGSSPRHSGTKMVIGADGKSYGTIGGSLLEATVIKESRLAVAEGSSRFLEFSLSGKDAQAQGMICGGTALVLLDYIAANPENQAFFQSWQTGRPFRQELFLSNPFKESGPTLDILGHSTLLSNGQIYRHLPFNRNRNGVDQGRSSLAFFNCSNTAR